MHRHGTVLAALGGDQNMEGGAAAKELNLNDGEEAENGE